MVILFACTLAGFFSWILVRNALTVNILQRTLELMKEVVIAGSMDLDVVSNDLQFLWTEQARMVFDLRSTPRALLPVRFNKYWE